MKHDIKTMTIIDGVENKAGNRLLATFDLSTGGIKIHGCILVLLSDGRMIAKGPTGKNHVGGKIRAEFADEDVQQAISDKAARVYAALTDQPLEAW